MARGLGLGPLKCTRRIPVSLEGSSADNDHPSFILRPTDLHAHVIFGVLFFCVKMFLGFLYTNIGLFFFFFF